MKWFLGRLGFALFWAIIAGVVARVFFWFALYIAKGMVTIDDQGFMGLSFGVAFFVLIMLFFFRENK
jgi:hypothetical protein